MGNRMTKKICSSALWHCLVAAALAQQPQSIKQQSKGGACTNIVALAGNITINCSTLTPKQQHLINRIPGLLAKILEHQIDPDAITAKLNEILAGVSSIQSDLSRQKEHEAERERIRRMAPQFEYDLFRDIQGDNDHVVQIKCNNKAPFMVDVIVTNRKGVYVAPALLEMLTLYPTLDRTHFHWRFKLNTDYLKEDPVVRVGVRFKSLSFDELGLNGHVGTMLQMYAVDLASGAITKLK